MTQEDAFVILNLIKGLGSVKAKRLLLHFNDATTILKSSINDLKEVSGVGDKLASSIYNWKNTVKFDEEMQLIKKGKVDILTPNMQEYPKLLQQIYDPPLCLYVRGNIKKITNNYARLAVVGSRNYTFYGKNMTEKFVKPAVQSGWQIVSGLALGIDTFAHQETVNNKGSTIAVLGSGLAHLYPQENLSLAKKICTNGAIISEFAMMAYPDKGHFPRRNRIISGLSLGTLVIEAGVRSGSLITAKMALDQSRNVYAIPGNIDQIHSKGTNELIKNSEAKLVSKFSDINEDFPNFSIALKEEENNISLDLTLKENEKIILELLINNDLTIDDIIIKSNLMPHTVSALLIQMETKKLIKYLSNKKYKSLINL